MKKKSIFLYNKILKPDSESMSQYSDSNSFCHFLSCSVNAAFLFYKTAHSMHRTS